MTTTYGTIPTSSSPSNDPSPNFEFVTRAKAQMQSGLGLRRPWKDMFVIHSLSLPTSLNEAQLRVRTNLAYFRMNYAIVMLLILFLSLLWHPISLIVFLLMMASWLFLYFLRETPLVVLGRVIDDRIALFVLAVLTVAFLFLTNVTANIVTALVVGAVVVVAHAAVMRTDDLPTDVGFEDEAVTPVVYTTTVLNLGYIVISLILWLDFCN
ncbi:hypothetical protein Cgig2_007182 [Carnegiea gigantea]|uniref:PRA1 family protein n=1 Tax=Carnegiea gigantea TaxID=171969 RepID=A0A9Q1QGL6_9CARY|nr:hypothetical protein Cgig2_007182 [Carnegiea gigantea]